MSALEQRNRNKHYTDLIKIFVGCEHCGKHPETDKDLINFDFHHVDPKTKVEKVSRLVSSGAALNKLVTELEKCDVLCRPCHMEIDCNWGIVNRR